MKKIILITLILTHHIWADFTRDATTNIISDLNTGLKWQDDVIPNKVNWKNALKYCENLSLGGYTDWRLPNKRELFSIIDFRYTSLLTSDFTQKVSEKYWTSTSLIGNESFAFTVSFGDASVTPNDSKTLLNNVRCTR